MGNENFMRRYVMRCGKMGGHGFQIGNVHDARETALHVCFSVEKSNAESPNDAKIQVWNLSDSNLKMLDTKDCVVELKAGYGDSLALILVGNITSVITTRENADRMTEMTVVDGRVGLRDAVISVSLNGRVDAKDVYQRIADAMGMPAVFAKDLSFKVLPNGFSYVGKAKNALQKMARLCGHGWTIQNQVLQIAWPGRAVSTRGHLLSSDTGLIGTPKRITISSSDGSQAGWEVEYFLNGAIGVNDVVQLKSPTANGYYLVHRVTFDGDNLEGDWICTAQLLEIKTQPNLDKKVEGTQKGDGVDAASAGEIRKGDKVKITRVFQQGNRTKGYQYAGGTFVCWHDAYDVIQVKGDRAVIGIGSTVTAAVNVKDLAKT